jgi:hypothetical protein
VAGRAESEINVTGGNPVMLGVRCFRIVAQMITNEYRESIPIAGY